MSYYNNGGCRNERETLESIDPCRDYFVRSRIIVCGKLPDNALMELAYAEAVQLAYSFLLGNVRSIVAR